MTRKIRIVFILVILFGGLLLTSCGSVLDTTIDEINQRYSDKNPMSESDVKVRLKEPIKVMPVSETEFISLWVPNHHDLEELKVKVENGEEIIGVFVKFEKTVRSFPRLNEETLEMEWYEKKVTDAVLAEKRVITITDLK